jgi:hypothetical protein
MAKEGKLGDKPVNVPNAFSPLPPEAAADPRFINGVGSMIAANQPHLRTGSPSAPPQDEGTYKPSLSDKSLASMKALEELQLRAQSAQDSAVPDSSSAEPPAPVVKDEIKESADLLDEFKSILGDDGEWDKLNNKERRSRIEKRLVSVNFTDILVHGEARQEIPIRDGLVITLRTVSGSEDLAVKRLMFREDGTDRYMVDKYSIMQLVLSLVAINDQALPPHMSSDNKFDDDLFWKKYDRVVRYPIEFIADFGLQYYWFHERIRDLLRDDTEKLKNG